MGTEGGVEAGQGGLGAAGSGVRRRSEGGAASLLAAPLRGEATTIGIRFPRRYVRRSDLGFFGGFSLISTAHVGNTAVRRHSQGFVRNKTPSHSLQALSKSFLGFLVTRVKKLPFYQIRPVETGDRLRVGRDGLGLIFRRARLSLHLLVSSSTSDISH